MSQAVPFSISSLMLFIVNEHDRLRQTTVHTQKHRDGRRDMHRTMCKHTHRGVQKVKQHKKDLSESIDCPAVTDCFKWTFNRYV